MIQNRQEFEQRMRSDRSFRKRILAAHKAGTLVQTLAQEGCAFDLNMLVIQIPQVRTNVHAGSCYCMISKRDSEQVKGSYR
jgi:hypothetical protein